MAPKHDAGDDTLCPIAHSTGLVGDRWSILIVRELLMGQRRFQDLQAQTGATSQMLAARLKRLEADGLIERHPYSERPPRHEYRLTPKGVDLMPVILALRAWGERWCKPEGGQPATRMFHRTCGSELELDGTCPACGGLVPWPDMRGQPSQAYADERARRLAEFTVHRRDAPGSQTDRSIISDNIP
ncbi:MAG: helix-turn-helix domain-containing protein [Phenylobacterium sp.]|uniref:winged helix-turn-helix transcriptional regulator n=1 Tax=Phenylobacterium sp. TaxID=1871053 RepID=UPI002719EC44|nr:helix-turn-helix domain-containing protein [Phenylobacterium sp.]MDO9433401.1 helix-turn-helix domain-containing protein [Phenylobacterium sp.]